MSAIYVWIDTFDGDAGPINWEALSAGKTLADQLSLPLTAVVFGKNCAAIANEAAGYGATHALICGDDTLEYFRLEPYAALLTRLVRDNAPHVVLAGATSRGRELIAAVAADTDSGLLTDVTSLEVSDDGALTVVRPVYAGKLLSEAKLLPAGTRFVTVRGRAFTPAERDPNATAEIVTVEPVLSEGDIPGKVEGFAVESGTVNLTDAAIIVSGGRGLDTNPKEPPPDAPDPKVWKAQDGFENTLRPLTAVLGAALGASRAAVDAGYIPYAHQVGQTGKTVGPDLYIAAGISGAIQHQAGMRTSKVIVAINRDADAPIFKLARYGLVGDLYEIVPALTAELEKRRAK